MRKLLSLFILLTACSCYAQQEQVSFIVVGDMMQHQLQFEVARTKDDTYDYSPCFQYVKDEISRHDVAIANFETTLGGKPYTGYPGFSSPDSYAAAIRDAGFDLLLTATNHSVDKRTKGLRHTIAVLDSLGLGHLGTYPDSAARRRDYPYLLEVKGFRIALLNYTYGTNGIKVPSPGVVNSLDTALMAIDIERAKQMEVDAIIVFPHWGLERHLLPSPQQRSLADWFLRKGVTHVIGSHPHVVQPIEVRTDAEGQRHLVAYSLGNYISNMTNVDSTGGLMLRFTLARDERGHCILLDADYSLVWVDRPPLSGKREFVVIPTSYPDSLLNNLQCTRRKSFYDNARNVLQKHNINITEKE